AVHRRLLQRQRSRRRTRRDDSQSERRRARRIRRADARRLLADAGPALRRRLEHRSRRAAHHPEDRAEPRTATSGDAGRSGDEKVGQLMAEQRPLLPWTLSYLRPYRGKVALLALLLVSEIGLGALQPWPLAVVLDFLTGKPLPHALTEWMPWIVTMAT